MEGYTTWYTYGRVKLECQPYFSARHFNFMGGWKNKNVYRVMDTDEWQYHRSFLRTKCNYVRTDGPYDLGS